MTIESLLEVDAERGLRIPMRDGTELVADLCRPVGDEPVPTLLYRTPYGRVASVTEAYASPSWYARHGFAVVCQDTRGRGDSPGEFVPFQHEGADGADTIEWISRQPWSNGRVGMYGFSYPGTVQLLAAAERPPALAAIAPAMATSSFHDPWTYANGAFQLAWIFLWVLDLARETAAREGDDEGLEILARLAFTPGLLFQHLPLRDAFPERVRRHLPYLADWLDHAADDARWRAVAPRERYAAIDVPALHVTGWYDVFLPGAIENFRGLVQAGARHQRLIAGPWWHTPWTPAPGGIDFGGDAASPIDDAQVSFFRRHLDGGSGDRFAAEPPVRVFVMGENRWRDLPDWPDGGKAPTTLFLRSGGRANSLGGDGRLLSDPPSAAEPPDVLPVDPNLPVAALGGRSCCYPGLAPMGPADQRGEEGRNDVLVYTGDVLEQEVTMIGEARLTLQVASGAASADLIVRLVDVHEDGSAINIADGNRRLALDETPRRVEIALSATAITFRAGHRIRLDVMGSSFPLFDRNPHSGVAGTSAESADLQFARHVLVHDAARPSLLELPTTNSSSKDLP